MQRFLVLLVAATILPLAATNAQTPPRGDAKAGKELFTKFGCYECHQYSGQGYNGTPGGARLMGLSMTVDAFTAYIRNPPRSRNMPPYTAKVMTDAQAADIWAYIQTFPPASEARDIPLLNQLMNEQK
jgi:mono/diheme cytochrome c family protein